MTRGHRGSLPLQRGAFSSPSPCRFIPALRKSGSQRCDQVLSEDFPGGAVVIPSGASRSFTFPHRKDTLGESSLGLYTDRYPRPIARLSQCAANRADSHSGSLLVSLDLGGSPTGQPGPRCPRARHRPQMLGHGSHDVATLEDGLVCRNTFRARDLAGNALLVPGPRVHSLGLPRSLRARSGSTPNAIERARQPWRRSGWRRARGRASTWAPG